MDLWNNGILAEKREKYPDILLAQLLDTSDDFLDWFVGQTAIPTKVSRQLGVRCNESSDGRETDVMVGFEGEDEEKYLILIEDKIKAQKQPSQFIDYHERGKSYVNRGGSDNYTVCLLAPENWLAPEFKENVDSVILYEDVIERLSRVDHDGATFIRSVFEECANDANTPVADFSNVTNELWRRIRTESGVSLEPRPGRKPVSPKHVRCVSQEPEHPDFIVYNVYLDQPDDFGQTYIRLQIDFTGTSFLDSTDTDVDALKSKFGESIDRSLTRKYPDFRQNYENIRSQNKNIIIQKIKHDEYSGFTDEEYYNSVVQEFCALVDKVYPIIVSTDFEKLARR